MDDPEASCVKSKAKEINRTYVISSMKSRCDEVSTAGRLTLQRRNTNSKHTIQHNAQEPSENTENQSQEKRLTLQRRTKAGAGAGSAEKSSHPHTPTKTEKRAWTSSKILSEPNCRTGAAPLRSVSLRERGLKDTTKPLNTPGRTAEKSQSTTRDQKTFSTPTGQTHFERISLKKEVFEKLSAKDLPKNVTAKHPGVEKQKPPSTETSRGVTPANKKLQVISQNRSAISTMRKTTSQMSAASDIKIKPPPCEAAVSLEPGSRHAASSSRELKMENSAVTVAVRVRPFSHRWTENTTAPSTTLQFCVPIIMLCSWSELSVFICCL